MNPTVLSEGLDLLGQEVEFTVGKDVRGILTGLSFTLGRGATFQISWIHEGEYRTAWIDRCEFRIASGLATKED